MTLSLPASFKPAAIFAALAYTSLTFGAAITPAPAQAAAGNVVYHAELSAPATGNAAKPIASGLVWKCVGTTCTAPQATSRPAIVCARLAKEVGPLNAFAVEGRAFEAEELARCNGK